MIRRLVVVRHGNTFNAGAPVLRIGRRSDLPLVASGRAQASALGRLLAERYLDAWIVRCGPLQRTRETAALICAERNEAITPQLDDALDEIDHGPDEGQPEAAVRGRLGDAALDRWDRLAEVPPGWPVDATARETEWQRLADELARSDVSTLIAVTSSGAARFALTGLGVVLPPSLKLATGAYGEIAIDGTRATLTAWNRRPQ